jgi:type IV secretory pathway TrbL component
MPVNDLLGAQVKVLGKGKVSIATATTTSIDFGTPDDLNLASNSAYSPGDRIVAIFDASTAGTTDTTAFVVQDAPDSSGSIGTTATAVTDVSATGDTLAGGTGDRYAVVGVRVQAGRPWLRFRATRASGTTDTTVVQVTVLAIPRGL